MPRHVSLAPRPDDFGAGFNDFALAARCCAKHRPGRDCFCDPFSGTRHGNWRDGHAATTFPFYDSALAGVAPLSHVLEEGCASSSHRELVLEKKGARPRRTVVQRDDNRAERSAPSDAS